MVFTNAFFTNNLNFTNQIEYVIYLANWFNKANIIYYSFTKCKQVTRSVLALKLYAMAHGFNVGLIIKSSLKKIMSLSTFVSIFSLDNLSTSTSNLSISILLLLLLLIIIRTNLKSLYNNLIKLRNIQKKRLIVDVICFK